MKVLWVTTTLIAGCAGSQQTSPDIAVEVDGVPAKLASATLKPASGSSVTGTIRLSEAEGGVQVDGTVQGLEPNSKHGFHIHENGDCSAPDASSAGGHYNPTGAPHGAPGPSSHVGDLGNITAGDMGEATFAVFAPQATLSDQKPGLHRIVDLAVIVHDGADDLISQPSGAAGPRVACGVIEVVLE